MIAHRKVTGCSDGYIVAIGNMEIAYNYFGGRTSVPICVPPLDYNQNYRATKPIIGAFKVQGQDWVVSEGGYYGILPHPFLVSKFREPKDRLPNNIFMQLFMQAYIDALHIEAQRVSDNLSKGEFTL